MELSSWKRLYHAATTDFPVSVYYFKPLRVRPTHKEYSRHMEPEFMLIHRGCMELRTLENQWLLKPGDIAFINPYELHSFRSVDLDVVEVCVRFFPDFLQLPDHHYFQKNFMGPLMAGTLRLPTVITADHPAYDRIYGALSELHPMREGTVGYREQLLQSVMSVCTAIASSCSTAEFKEELSTTGIRACLEFIHKNYTKKLSLEQLAQHAGVHPNYLCAKFRAVKGQSVFSYICELRIDHAKRLLSTTQAPINEVARQSGFSDISAFRVKFKKICGMTPKEYQKTFSKQSD